MEIKFDTTTGLAPAIIQDATTQKVLMLGYMNKEAYEQTIATKRITFYSRSKQRLWVKGETSGNYLALVDIKADCDQDSLLIQANPEGPTCHTGSDTCWNESNQGAFINHLENTIRLRKEEPQSTSYTSQLFEKGMAKIAQKVGEEAVEVVIEAMGEKDDLLLEESADLLFHYLILLRAKGYGFKDVIDVLQKRHKS